MQTLILGVLIAVGVVLAMILPGQSLEPHRRALLFVIFFATVAAIIAAGPSIGFLLVSAGTEASNPILVATGLLVALVGVGLGGFLGYVGWTERWWR